MRLKAILSTVVAFSSLVCIAYLFPREDALLVQFLFFIAFISYLFQLRVLNTRTGFIVGFALRLCLLFSIPSLSTDFYRFLWDGHLLKNGINPFSITPQEYFESLEVVRGFPLELYEGLAYKIYYSMYAPVTQFTGWVAVEIGVESLIIGVVILRIFIIAAEVVVYKLIGKILIQMEMNPRFALLYWLNPLVILELTGNLHHEVYVILFMLAAVLFFSRGRN